MTSITPDHRHSTPAMEMPSRTAEPAPSRAAAETASRFPVKRANTREKITIPDQTQVIAMGKPP